MLELGAFQINSGPGNTRFCHGPLFVSREADHFAHGLIVKPLANVNCGMLNCTTTVCAPSVAFAGIVKFASTVPCVV